MNTVADVAEVNTPPLVDWNNPPTVEDLKQDLTHATPYHSSQVSKIESWLDNLHVRGNAAAKTPKGRSRITPKLIRKQAEWRYAALSEPFLSTDDLFNVRPVTWEDRNAAIQNELLLGHQFNSQLDKTAFIDEYVRTAVDEGTVIVKVGWEYQDEEYDTTEPIVEFQVNPALAELHQSLAQMKVDSPSQYLAEVPDELKQAHDLTIERGIPIEPVVIGQQEVTKTRVLKNQPTLDICNVANVTIDPSCLGRIDKAGFVIYSFETSLAELRKDTRYKNLDRIQVESASPLGLPDHEASTGSGSFSFSDEPRKRLVAHEYWGYWDIHGTGTVEPFVATWVGSTLIRMEENPFPDRKLPFVAVSYLPVRKSVYGEPDGALLEDNQKIIGAVTRGMIDLMGRSANGQTGMRQDMLDVTNKRKFLNGEDYEFNMNVDPRAGVYMHTFPEIPSAAPFMLELQNMEAESLTGVKAFSQGISQQALGNVATAVRGALDAASKRELGILRRLSKGIVDIGRKFISMNQVFLSDEEVVRVTNAENVFATIKREELTGDFDLRLTISTPEEDEAKAQELAFMLQTMGNNMAPELSQMILSDIARLRKMPDLSKRIAEYQPQPDPLQQRKAELEVQLLEAQLQNEMAHAQQRSANAQLDNAKVGTEYVKQGNIQSDTDQKNLDFVEQESGVTQERDLQKHGEQARSQAQLKLLDRQFQREDNEKDREFQLVRDFLSKRSV